MLKHKGEIYLKKEKIIFFNCYEKIDVYLHCMNPALNFIFKMSSLPDETFTGLFFGQILL